MKRSLGISSESLAGAQALSLDKAIGRILGSWLLEDRSQVLGVTL